MKFSEIYAVLRERASGQPGFSMRDFTPRPRQPSAAYRHLWIIAEDRAINRRIWITKEFGTLRVTTARLDLDVKSNEYSENQSRRQFGNQRDMADYLKTLLKTCERRSCGMKKLRFIGIDGWDRPVYRDETGRLWKDVNLGCGTAALHSASGNDFDGEPDMPIKEEFEIIKGESPCTTTR